MRLSYITLSIIAKSKKGDLLLIDSGAEKNYYTADVTRVYPADKKFTAAQRDVYEVVLDAQKELSRIQSRANNSYPFTKKQFEIFALG